MPADSRHVDEEGVLIDNFQMIDGGVFREAETRALLLGGRGRCATSSRTWPTCARRSPPTRRASRSCAICVARWGLPTVRAYMRHVQDNAEQAVRRAIGALDDGDYEYRLDPADDAPTRDASSASRSASTARAAPPTIDFTGTSPQLAEQLQRAAIDHGRRRALRLPHAGRRRHPAQRRLPGPAAHRRARRLDAEPALSRRRRRRQRRDHPVRHARAATARSA